MNYGLAPPAGKRWYADISRLRLAVDEVFGLLPRRSSVPDLRVGVIVLDRSSIEVHGSDLVRYGISRIAARGASHRTVTVELARMSTILDGGRESGEVELALDQRDDSLRIGDHMIPCLPRPPFLKPPPFDWALTWAVAGHDLAAVLETSTFAATVQKPDFSGLSGTMLELRTERISAVSTDKFQLAKRSRDLLRQSHGAEDVLLATEDLPLILDWFGTEPRVTLATQPYHLVLSSPTRTLYQRLTDATHYPKYHALIEAPPDAEVVVDRNELLNVLDRIDKIGGSLIWIWWSDMLHLGRWPLAGAIESLDTTAVTTGASRADEKILHTLRVDGRYLRNALLHTDPGLVRVGYSSGLGAGAPRLFLCPRRGEAFKMVVAGISTSTET